MLEETLNRLKTNWKSGITVSLVSIPLSVSLAVASQTSPTIGIITAIWAGLIASLFAGSNFNIVGPTGALSGVIAAFVLTSGIHLLPTLTIAVGIIILVAYFLRLERYLVFVPASTIHGFTLGVALIIALNQANYALGITGLPVHEKLLENIAETTRNITSISSVTFGVFFTFLAGLFFFAKMFPKLPGAIILAPIGILIGYLSSTGFIPMSLLTLGMKYENITGTLFSPYKLYFDTSIIVPALVIALIAILETMISAKIADGMTNTKHHKRKETLGLGLANIVAGFMGGMPATAALARTSLNIKTGANHKISATVSSIAIAVISILFLQYFKYIPLAVVASILVFIAIRMIEQEHFIRMYKLDKKSFAIALLVAIISIIFDPIIGILFGVAVSLLLFVDNLSKGQYAMILNDSNKMIERILGGGEKTKILAETETLVYSIEGQLTYVNSQAHISRFEKKLENYKNVILRMRSVHIIDLDGVDAFDEIVENILAQGKKVLVTGINTLISDLLKESLEYRKLRKNNYVFETTVDALKSLGYKIKNS